MPDWLRKMYAWLSKQVLNEIRDMIENKGKYPSPQNMI